MGLKPLKILDLMSVWQAWSEAGSDSPIRLVKFFTNSGYTLGDCQVRASLVVGAQSVSAMFPGGPERETSTSWNAVAA